MTADRGEVRSGRAGPERRRAGPDPGDLPRTEIIGVTPFGRPAPHVAVAVARAGGLGVLDLGTDRTPALAALADVGHWWKGPFGVRVPAGCRVRPDELPDAVGTVLIDAPGLPAAPSRIEDDAVTGFARGRRLLVEVVDPDEAAAALRFAAAVRSGAGLHPGNVALIARGSEAGGRVGDLTTFVLLQHLLADPDLDVAVYAAGGIGPHSAAAAVAGGAAGVVLDVQLALVREMELPADVAAALSAMDGAETRVVEGHRVFTRPDLPEIDLSGLSPAQINARLGATGLHTRLLPVGQDGPLAAALAARYKTAGGVVQAIREQIVADIRAAVRAEPLARRHASDDAFAASSAAAVEDAPAVEDASAGTSTSAAATPSDTPSNAPGPEYPVVQGPMTQVSDSSAFAAAVAQDGGLPFLALALMDGERVRELLLDTADRLGDRPWGVGILGFAPPEVREAQLAAVQEVGARSGCSYALIAGGRPAQAVPLEEAGMAAYLHVPSPELLDRFLAEGTRKFVFEGMECGGHVGPRASFPLWEAQVERLLAFADEHPGAAAGMSVMFAGGIHDERSAAMVAALSGPLAERGADIRVLMGTAYLFTYEAVAAGAILSGFQRTAIECAGTALLATSPGHATRCARTPYVDAFEEARRELERAGTARQEAWRRLEELNLGRLRIASKGLRRDPSGAGVPSGPGGGGAGKGPLQQVGPDEQRSHGMYMIGQVAALRSATTSIPVLHEQVTTGATGFLAARAAELGIATRRRGMTAGTAPAADGTARSRPAEPVDIAIVGIGCVFPGSRDADEFWAMVVGGRNAITEVPADRWDPAVYYDPVSARGRAGGTTPSKWGGFLPDIPFDALAYGIPPSALGSIEPVQLLALEVAARALDDAGYRDRPFDRSRTSVFFGAEGGTELATAYGVRATLPGFFGEVPAGLDRQLPRPTEDSFPGVLTNVIAGRIANRLDLGGANCTLDAACAASLAALDAACKDLATGGSDMVLCGGADVHNGIYDYLLFSWVNALSPSGRCAPFDSGADGIALGEGVGCVVLKRLADAERDGDRIYAVVKSVGAASDGRSLGLTAPRAEGQRLALERAYERAGVSPADVGLVEAHGTGTEVGDRTELATLTRVFTEAGAAPASVTLGSVKSQIGHTKCAAGLAGLIKAARALHTGVLPGTLHLTRPNEAWDPGTSPFSFGGTARPWPAAPGDRYAALSGFGFGGANFHTVLAGYDGAPEPVSGLAEWPAELFLIRGVDRAAAGAELERLRALLDDGRAGTCRPKLRDLARTFAPPAAPGAGGRVQAALVATGLDDLRAKLAAAAEFRTAPGVFVAASEPPRHGETGQVAFLYPGQGSQRPNMLADLFVAFPRLQRLLRGLHDLPDLPDPRGVPGVPGEGRHARAMFPPAAFTPEDRRRQRADLTDTRVAQPTLGIAGLAVHRLLTELGVHPDLAAGHSYGELVALCAAGVFDERDMIELSAARAEAILAAAARHGADPGAMAAVTGSLREVRDILAGVSEIGVANHNTPRQVVVSGTTAGLERAMDLLAERGLAAERLPVACAFHSPLVAGAAGGLRAELNGRDLRSPAFPVWSNMTAAPYDTDPAQLAATLAGQVGAPVRFVEQIEAMYAAGARTFVEAGPGRVLTGLVGEILGDRPHTAVCCDVPGENGLERLLLALAELAVAGVPVDPLPLFAGRDARPVTADAAGASAPGWIVNGHLVRTAGGGFLDGALRPAERVGAPPSGSRPVERRDAGAGRGEPEAEAAVLEYLRTSREMLAAQRDVVLGFLGTAPPGGLPLPSPGAPGEVAADRSRPAQPVGPARPGDPSEPAERVRLGPDEIHAAVIAVISSKTGYPESMLGDDLDMEADLSIDSIKRTVIIGELAERVGLVEAGSTPGTPLDDALVEQLARIRTIGEIVGWIGSRLDSDAEPAAPSSGFSATPAPQPAQQPAPQPASQPTAEAGPSMIRQVVRMAELPSLPVPDGSATMFAGRRFVIVDDGGGIALQLADLLERQGAQVRTPLEPDGPCDGLIHLAALRPGGVSVLPGAYEGIRRALLDGLRWLVVAGGAGGTFGRAFGESGTGDPTPAAGLLGLARTVAQEYPEVFVRALDIGTKDDPRNIALRILAEMMDMEGPVAVGYEGSIRRTPTVVPAELPADCPNTPNEPDRTDARGPDGPGGTDSPRGPGGPGAAREIPWLGPDGVVLLTGGARGITARVARELARTSGCHVEVMGRTPAPGDEQPYPDAEDEAALRRALVVEGGRAPAEIEAMIRRILAGREIRRNLEAVRENAASVRYHAGDVRDPQAVRALVGDIYARHGRLDGVVHGAGLLEDRLIRDKEPASFCRVYRTKADGACALADAVRPDIGFFVVFGSVSGVYGNRGQADYAAANDACDTLAHVWRTRLGGRVLVADWGPWAGGGMVSPELADEYARRGIGLIEPDAGVAALLREITFGDEVQVVLTASAGGSPGSAGVVTGSAGEAAAR